MEYSDMKFTERIELAKKYQTQIREAIAERFPVSSVDELAILVDEDAIYIDEEFPLILCCLVVGKENKYLYLVTADIDEEKRLDGFTAQIVS